MNKQQYLVPLLSEGSNSTITLSPEVTGGLWEYHPSSVYLGYGFLYNVENEAYLHKQESETPNKNFLELQEVDEREYTLDTSFLFSYFNNSMEIEHIDELVMHETDGQVFINSDPFDPLRFTLQDPKNTSAAPIDIHMGTIRGGQWQEVAQVDPTVNATVNLSLEYGFDESKLENKNDALLQDIGEQFMLAVESVPYSIKYGYAGSETWFQTEFIQKEFQVDQTLGPTVIFYQYVFNGFYDNDRNLEIEFRSDIVV